MVGGRTSIPAASRQEPRRAEVQLHRRADHGEQARSASTTAWGRTLKDVFQRYKALRGFDQRYQNGFDCQGLSGRGRGREGARAQLEARDRGVRPRRVRARAAASVVVALRRHLTEQSKRLGQWMDWGNDYFTFSDTNIEYIWRFLEGRPRPRLALHGPSLDASGARAAARRLSQHEQAGDENYDELEHPSLFVRFPLLDARGRVARRLDDDAVDAARERGGGGQAGRANTGRSENGEWVARRALPGRATSTSVCAARSSSASDYQGPFDDLPAQAGRRAPRDPVGRGRARRGHGHRPHRARLRRAEDFELSRAARPRRCCAPIDESGRFCPGYG